jgi:Uma2 family endonuclease
MHVELRRRRFTVDEYYAMAEAGILTEEDRVELIEGEIVQKITISPPHAVTVDRLGRTFVQQAGEDAVVRVQNPLRLSDLSEPEPDFVLARPGDYSKGHPRARDALLVVEVAHSSLGYDREIKLPLYALAGVPEVWIVNLDDSVVEVYSEPAGYEFRRRVTVRAGETLSPERLPSVQIPVALVLG